MATIRWQRFAWAASGVAAVHLLVTISIVVGPFSWPTAERLMLFPLFHNASETFSSVAVFCQAMLNSLLFGLSAAAVALAAGVASLSGWRRFALHGVALAAWFAIPVLDPPPLTDYHNGVVGIVGLILAVVGFALTLEQVRETMELARKARTAAEAAREALSAASIRYERFSINRARLHAEKMLVLALNNRGAEALLCLDFARDELAQVLKEEPDTYAIAEIETILRLMGETDSALSQLTENMAERTKKRVKLKVHDISKRMQALASKRMGPIVNTEERNANVSEEQDA